MLHCSCGYGNSKSIGWTTWWIHLHTNTQNAFLVYCCLIEVSWYQSPWKQLHHFDMLLCACPEFVYCIKYTMTTQDFISTMNFYKYLTIFKSPFSLQLSLTLLMKCYSNYYCAKILVNEWVQNYQPLGI